MVSPMLTIVASIVLEGGRRSEARSQRDVVTDALFSRDEAP